MCVCVCVCCVCVCVCVTCLCGGVCVSVFFFFWCVCACVCSVVCVCVCVSETLCLPPEPARVYQSVSCLFITECGIISLHNTDTDVSVLAVSSLLILNV